MALQQQQIGEAKRSRKSEPFYRDLVLRLTAKSRDCQDI